MVQPVFVVHGGAGDIPDCRKQVKYEGIKKAAMEGHRVLYATGNVLDAVEAAVRTMEDDENFNAGRGSTLNAAGEVAMDALVTEGKNLSAGSVTLVKNIANPISLARMVMEKTPHAILGGEGVEEFIVKMGFPRVPDDYLITEFEKKALEEFRKRSLADGKSSLTNVGDRTLGDVGTVGCVAVDSTGHVASGTSTGGTTGKYKGRIGDTPLPGCGGYSDDEIGAVSSTGHGETILKYNLAHRILTLMQQGESPQNATVAACESMTKRIGNTGGAITVSNKGEIGIGFTTDRMAWAYQLGDEYNVLLRVNIALPHPATAIHYFLVYLVPPSNMACSTFCNQLFISDSDQYFNDKSVTTIPPVLLVHGGAEFIPDSDKKVKLDGVKESACEGYRVLIETGCVLDAVEAAIRVMEMNSAFNAGSVTLARNIAHPISLARMVMECSPHAIIGGNGVQDFIEKMGVTKVPDCYLITQNSMRALEKFKQMSLTEKTHKFVEFEEPGSGDTVGCVAVDMCGHVASGTSSGGLTGKYKGRIGDSPIPGSGGYSDDEVGAISVTGHGELILQCNFSHRVLSSMKEGKSAGEAAAATCEHMTKRLQKPIMVGAIIVSNKGEVGIYFSTKHMPWAYQVCNELHYGINQGEDICVKLN
ncbi:unnamed protein product [Nezara viridula]|uniref:Uncharacterized protein n=1 Tax=Nezara viridula TaxID=85310 RepID=A0A9P0HJF2_NEZVI|nr:unnamed protein product [Nezara viridula]